jgi:hypothetical protein
MDVSQHRAKHLCSRTHSSGRHHELPQGRNFFLSAVGTAFLAEVVTLHLLGIGSLTEPYYWLFILLTSVPFVLLSFLLVRLVVPLSLKDVLHLSFHPIGAGVFTGAIFALVASAVVKSLVAVGFIPEIKFDFSQWGDAQQMIAVNKRALHDCLREGSLVSTGLQAAYNDLKPPIDSISYLRAHHNGALSCHCCLQFRG